jgi:hypothetical protein
MANYWRLYERAKKFYFNLGKMACPAFGGREILFDHRGWRHIVRKRRIRRSISDQVRRLQLIFIVKDVLNAACITEIRNEQSGNDKIQFISTTSMVDARLVKTVVMQKGADLFYISMMEK